MFRKKKKEGIDPKVVIAKAKEDTLVTALTDILKLQYPPDGAVNYEQTVRMIRARARMALDVMASIGESEKKENTAKADK